MGLLMACQPAAPIALEPVSGATSTAAGSAAPTATPGLGIDLRVPPTRVPRPSVAASPLPGASVSVTLADDGRTIALQPGQRVLVNLGDELDWRVQVDDESVVSRVSGDTLVRGAQGLYQARRVGHTTLNATGDPACRKVQPACAQPARTFTVTIAVHY